MVMNSQWLLSILSLCAVFFMARVEALDPNQFQILIYTRHDPHHKDTIPTALNAFKSLAAQHHFGVEWTQDPNILTGDELKTFAAVVFLNGDGDVFDQAQKSGLETYIKNGGGFVGLHAASTSDGSWPWYDNLIGRVFIAHPKVQTAVLRVEDQNFPATLHLQKQWLWTDEWYTFGDAKTKKVKTLLTVDESTYDTLNGYGRPIQGMGKYHPVAWYQYYDGGRSFYSALGHKPEAYLDADYLNFLYGGIYWAATGRGSKP
jgi:uncharacterized protein